MGLKATRKWRKEYEKAEKEATAAEKRANKMTSLFDCLKWKKVGGGSGHNCPHKDAGTTHAFQARCLRLKHAGYCPRCAHLVSYKDGCHSHGHAGEELLLKPKEITVDVDAKAQNDLDAEDNTEGNDDEPNQEVSIPTIEKNPKQTQEPTTEETRDRTVPYAKQNGAKPAKQAFNKMMRFAKDAQCNA